MALLTAAVVLVGLLGVLNLVLTLGLARRVNGRPAASLPLPMPIVLKPGDRPAAFTTTTTDGDQISDDTLTGVVGFFTAGCKPCHELVPSFAAHARAVGRDNVLAVVQGPDQDLVDALTPVARVIADGIDGPVTGAFQNRFFPALYLFDQGHRILATGGSLEDLPAEALA